MKTFEAFRCEFCGAILPAKIYKGHMRKHEREKARSVKRDADRLAQKAAATKEMIEIARGDRVLKTLCKILRTDENYRLATYRRCVGLFDEVKYLLLYERDIEDIYKAMIRVYIPDF